MSTTQVDSYESEELLCRPRRQRGDNQRGFGGVNTGDKTLEVDGVIKVLNNYEESEQGGINCSVCGKLYKSKVCLTKHLWEHSIYWDMFAGEKNHDRVLSIQAAIILLGLRDNQSMASLLVTSPHEKKPKTPEKDACKSGETDGTAKSIQRPVTNTKRKLSLKNGKSPQKRHRTFSGSDSGICSSSDSENTKSWPVNRNG